jgi:Zn-dependent M28 family amino/carboxypeptidase
MSRPFPTRVSVIAISWLVCGLAAAGEVVVVRGPLGPDDAHRIAKRVALYGDFGYFAIGEGDAGAVADLRAQGLDAFGAGEWGDDIEIYVARDAYVPDGVEVLAKHSGQTLFRSPDHHGDGCGCGHTIAHVTRRPITPSRGFRSPSSPQTAIAVDPRVAALVAQVNQANIQNTVVQLSSYFTRRADSTQVQTAKNWIVAQLQAIPGVAVTTQTFSGSYAPNVIATITGTTHPERIIVLGAHYDSINLGGSGLTAPGADDNATGSGGILEATRILAQSDYENTIRLMFYCAEEFGLVGSDYDASQLASQGANVVAMLNMDMIGHLQAGDSFDLDFASNDTNASLTQFCRDVTAAYVAGLPTKLGVLTAGTSDHRSYHQAGFPAAFFFEDLDQYSTVIHTANDTIASGSANSFTLARDITKAFVASAAILAQPVDLSIAHTPLADTTDGSGPYVVTSTITSLIGSSVAAAEVHYRVNGGAWQVKPLLAGIAANQFVGSIPGVFPSGAVEYYFVATDANGYQQYSPDTAEQGAGYHGFAVGNGTTIFADDFDGASTGWTSAQVATQNDWQIGPPNGESTDPSSAFSGSQVRGNDLGAGNFNGEYTANVENYLDSPNINCSGKSNVRLSYRRWLGVEDGFYDQAKVEVNGATIWQNPTTPGGGTNHLVDATWQPIEHDISAQAANNPAVKIRFRMKSDGGLEFGGWTIDDFRVFSFAAGTKKVLAISEAFISQSLGGSATFALDFGATKAGRTYVLALSATGNAPGTPLGSVTVPLVFDAATNLGFSLLNTPVFANFAGALSGAGTAAPSLNLPPLGNPALAGLNLHFAAFTLAPVDIASNSVTVQLLP